MGSQNFIKLSSSYFWYFAILGLIVPFLSVFLDGRGFNSREIGEILAIVAATKILGPPIWANMADKAPKLLPIIQQGTLLATLSFALLYVVESYWLIAGILAVFSLFWNAVLPQLEVLTLGSVRYSAKIYARIRLWGSIGFVVLAVVAGEVIGTWGSDTFITLGMVTVGCLYLSTLTIKERGRCRKANVQSGALLHKIFHINFLLFFCAGLLLQVSLGPFYSFFALFLRDLAYPQWSVGLYMSIGVVAEIGIFIVAGKLYQAFGTKWLIVFSLFATAIRWWLTGEYGDVWWMLALVQVLHATSFGLYHSASLQFLQQHFSKAQQNRGQAVYIAGVYGIGGSLGAYLAGLLWLDGAGAQWSFQLAAIASLIAAFIAMFLKPPSTSY
ncbi:MFS transporter [Thalassotalea fusca]